jgi:hypothetical protein
MFSKIGVILFLLLININFNKYNVKDNNLLAKI